MPGSFANIGAKEYLAEFSDREGILFVGKAQEKGVRRPYDHEETSHEYAKRQLDKRGIKYEPLDNGILSCEDPQALQKICEGLNEAKIDRLLRKWLKRLPHPFPAKDRHAGFVYEVFMQQVSRVADGIDGQSHTRLWYR